MGTLIIFIAMVLIAAVAAGVLLTTTSNLQAKALETGKAVKTEAGTHLQVMQIFGDDASIANDLDNIYVIVKLAAGSDSIRLQDMLVSLGLNNANGEYSYKAGTACLGGLATDYEVEYMMNSSSHADGYLVQGDIAKICLIAPRGIKEAEQYRIQITPRAGASAVVVSTTPDAMSKHTEYIFP